MAHLCALATPCGGSVAIGKLYEIECILDIGIELVNRLVGIGIVPVLILARHAHIEYR